MVRRERESKRDEEEKLKEREFSSLYVMVRGTKETFQKTRYEQLRNRQEYTKYFAETHSNRQSSFVQLQRNEKNHSCRFLFPPARAHQH